MQTSAVDELEVTSDILDKIVYVPVDSIIINTRKREISEARVAVLADSIKTLGLLQPIVINKDYHLVAGLHRRGAFIKLGIDEIPAVFKEYKSIDAELAEIDENLVRFELTDMERALQYKRRKEIYEFKFPQTIYGTVKDENGEPISKRELLRRQWEAEGKPTDNPNIPNFDSEDAQRTDVKPFVKDTADKTGRASSQIRDEAELGKRLMDELSPEIRGLIAPTPSADNKSDLKRLLDEPDEDIKYEAAKAVRESYDEWEAIDDNKEKEKAKAKIVKLGDILSKLQAPATYENTVSESGEDTLHKTLQKTLKSLELSVNDSKFKEVAKTWTYEGIDDIREDFYRIVTLAKHGAEVLTSIMEIKQKNK